MITFDPTTTKKPNYIEAFDAVGALPPEIKQSVRHLLLRIWKHTNSSAGHPLFGKAWMSHPHLAREMGCATVNDLFDEAEKFGVIGREHLFKKSDGKTVVSDQPYRKGANKGRGEYIGSRYWVNWEKVNELGKNGIAKNATPPEKEHPPDGGMVKNATPIGIAKNATPKESATYEKIGVAKNAIPVAKNATKGLIEGSPHTLHPPQAATESASDPSGEPKPTREPIQSKNQNPVVVVGAKPKTSGQKSTDAEERSEAIIAEHLKRQLERKMTDDEIFREYKKIFDRLRNEFDTYRQALKEAYQAARAATGMTRLAQDQNEVLDAMPRGKNFDNDLKSTVKQRHNAAELYRTKGHDTAMREWEEYLVKHDHKVITVDAEEDDDGIPTGRKIPNEVESTNLLHFFVLEYGVELAVKS
jgi:hypothetical protein